MEIGFIVVNEEMYNGMREGNRDGEAIFFEFMHFVISGVYRKVENNS